MSASNYPIWIIGRRSDTFGLEVVFNTMGNDAQSSWKTLSPEMAEMFHKQGFRAMRVQMTDVFRRPKARVHVRTVPEQALCEHSWRKRKRTMGKNSGYDLICTKCMKIGSSQKETESA